MLTKSLCQQICFKLNPKFCLDKIDPFSNETQSFLQSQFIGTTDANLIKVKPHRQYNVDAQFEFRAPNSGFTESSGNCRRGGLRKP